MSDPFGPSEPTRDPRDTYDTYDTVIVPLAEPGATPAAADRPAPPARSTWRQPLVWAVVGAALVGGGLVGAGVATVNAVRDESPATATGPVESGAEQDPGTLPDGPDATAPDGTLPEEAPDLGSALRDQLAGQLGEQLREQLPGDLGKSLGDLVEDPAVGEQVQRLIEDLLAGGSGE